MLAALTNKNPAAVKNPALANMRAAASQRGVSEVAPQLPLQTTFAAGCQTPESAPHCTLKAFLHGAPKTGTTWAFRLIGVALNRSCMEDPSRACRDFGLINPRGQDRIYQFASPQRQISLSNQAKHRITLGSMLEETVAGEEYCYTLPATASQVMSEFIKPGMYNPNVVHNVVSHEQFDDQLQCSRLSVDRDFFSPECLQADLRALDEIFKRVCLPGGCQQPCPTWMHRWRSIHVVRDPRDTIVRSLVERKRKEKKEKEKKKEKIKERKKERKKKKTN